MVPDTKSGTPGADAVKVKGTITWVGVHDAVPAEVRLYDRLFTEPQPDAGGRDFRPALNPHSKRVVRGYRRAVAGRRWRRRRGSSSSATATSSPTASITRAGRPVFNRITGAEGHLGQVRPDRAAPQPMQVRFLPVRLAS